GGGTQQEAPGHTTRLRATVSAPVDMLPLVGWPVDPDPLLRRQQTDGGCLQPRLHVLLLHDEDKRQWMSPEQLDTFIREFLGGQPDGEVTLAWQGGEPTLRGL